MTFQFLPPAKRELREAAQFYEKRVPRLGLEFMAEVEAAIFVSWPIRTHGIPWTKAYAVAAPTVSRMP